MQISKEKRKHSMNNCSANHDKHSCHQTQRKTFTKLFILLIVLYKLISYPYDFSAGTVLIAGCLL